MKENDEIVEGIANSIHKHRQLETENLIGPIKDRNLAVALSNVYYMDKPQKIWITTKENLGGYQSHSDITGTNTILTAGARTTYSSNGNVVYRNSKVGEILIRNSKGTHLIPTPKGSKEMIIYNLSSYKPSPHEADAADVTININERNPRRYNRLRDLLTFISGTDDVIQKLEEKKIEIQERPKEAEVENQQKENDLAELQDISARIIEEESKREEALNKVHSFIRKNAELRYQPILDPWQEEIKRSMIFEGTMAIDGGPGTGKTTALIQRIKFLTDEDAMLGQPSQNNDLNTEGYLPNLTQIQKEKLFGYNRNWVFFTPNELLKLFLKNSMIQEGLEATDSRVLIWDDYLVTLIKQYKLVNTETQNPFLFLREYKIEDLLPYNGKALNKILKEYEKYFLGILNERLQKLTSIDVQPFSWKTQGTSIQNYIKKQEKDYTIEGLIRLYFNIQETYREEVKDLITEYTDLLNPAAARLIRKMESENDFKDKAYTFAENWIKESSTTEESEEDEDEDEELDGNTGNVESFLYSKFRVLIKNTALMKYDPGMRLGKKYRELNELISPYLNVESFEELDDIGQLAFFSKYFVRSTRGIVSNIISEIPRSYKSFRKQELALKKRKWNFNILKYIVEDDNSRNKRIHPDEQALLIYFVNTLIAKAYKVSKLKSREINHSYFQAFREVSVPVIGVDEATDFHIIDLIAIHSLSDLEISSVTYSGDIMQRLTSSGIRSWEELNGFIRKFEVKELQISYRQSPTLLEVATKIYNRATKKEAEYISFMDKDPKEPKPLLFRNENEVDKINWIAERILEIYYAYGSGSIPSIAIFLPDDDIDQFAKQLGDIDALADVGIHVRASKDGNVLGDANTVRVFPVNYIKGMEFQAVFFHNLDGIAARHKNEEMVMKNLYVGLSRASFYMGITMTEDTAEFAFLNELFETENLSWK